MVNHGTDHNWLVKLCLLLLKNKLWYGMEWTMAVDYLCMVEIGASVGLMAVFQWWWIVQFINLMEGIVACVRILFCFMCMM